ncbi:MAG: SurA N-terminal domain-containing protein [Candidatus Omnitrophica bacterium]|nr:SurA N-terminal domain-containing protein [Candidatus Omnitrophota bacterium]
MYCYCKFSKFLLLLVIFISVFLSGCARTEHSGGEEVVAYVNKEPIFASELKKGIAFKARQDPALKVTAQTREEELDIAIDKRLVIQEAINQGLAEEDKFVDTIKAFWEQTLIRDFIDFKKEEFKDYLFVTNEEIEEYYKNLSKRVTFKVFKSKDRRQIDNIYKTITNNQDFGQVAWETVGPVGYEDITSKVLLEAFELKEAEAKKVEQDPYYYLVMVVDKEEVEIEPLDEALVPEVEKRVLMMKQRSMFEDWLVKQRQKAQINILKK